MRILTAPEMRAADEATFEQLGVSSRAVMEAAGRHVAELLVKKFSHQLAFGVMLVTGPGNNGGDGFVIARSLLHLGIRTSVLAVRAPVSLKGDAQTAALAYEKAGGEIHLLEKNNLDRLAALLNTKSFGLIVDAILGTGVQGELGPEIKSAIDFINTCAAARQLPVVSVDVPSGVESDSGLILGAAVRATLTVSLAALKLCHVLAPSAELCGTTFVTEIGVPTSSFTGANTRELLTAEMVSALLRESKLLTAESHKGSRGHVLVVGGSSGKSGAPRLSALAVLREGAGLVTLALPESGIKDKEHSKDEFMEVGLAEEKGELASITAKDAAGLLKGKTAVVIGPGMGTGPGPSSVLKEIIAAAKAAHLPIVIDADALNILARERSFLSSLDKNTILTPHPGEMSRLTDRPIPEIQKARFSSVEFLRDALSVIVVLKGAKTLIANPPQEVYVNPASTSVLGTGGSGDSLAGIIGALCAQGLTPRNAALVGVYAHGVAGEALERKQAGPFGVIASDISEEVARVLNQLQSLTPGVAFSQQMLPDPWVEKSIHG